MENKYFTRKVSEGTVKRTHICSFDETIELSYLQAGCRKVMDNIFKVGVTAQNDILREKTDGESNNKTAIANAKQAFVEKLANTRFNGLEMVYEDFINAFDEDEFLEVYTFMYDGDLTPYKGEKSTDLKNV